MFRFASSVLTLLLLPLVGAWPAAAQYPERPLTILSGYPAGGMVDIVARALAEGLKKKYPKGVGVVTRPGRRRLAGGGRAGAGQAGRLHGHPGADLHAGHPSAAQRSAVQDAGRLRSDHQHGGVLLADRGEGRRAVEDDAGVRGRGQGQPRQAARGLARRRHLEPPEPRGAQASGRRRTSPTCRSRAGASRAPRCSAATSRAWSAQPGEVRPLVEGGKLRALMVFQAKRNPVFPDVPTAKELGWDAAERHLLHGGGAQGHARRRCSSTSTTPRRRRWRSPQFVDADQAAGHRDRLPRGGPAQGGHLEGVQVPHRVLTRLGMLKKK